MLGVRRGVPESWNTVRIRTVGRFRTGASRGRRHARSRWPFVAFLVGLVAAPVSGQQSVAQRADSAWTRGDHRLAERLYRTRLEAQPDDATALHRLVLIGLRRSAFDECDALLGRLLVLAPNDSEVQVTRARLTAARGNLKGARAIVDSILSVKPADVGALQARGLFLGRDADRTGSERAWRQALTLDPANLDSRLGLARALRQQGRHAAAAEILHAVPPDSTYRDLLDELDWIEVGLGARATTTFVYEDDSDGNAIATLVMNGAMRPAGHLEIRAGAYVRDAELSGSVRQRTARGANVSVWTQVEPGWTFLASAGGATSDADDAVSLPAWGFAVGTPARNRIAATISVAETPFDVTAITTDNRVSYREVALDGRWSPSRSWLLQVEAGAARFEADASGQSNERWRSQAELVRRLNDLFGIALAGRAFGFADDFNDGYFDPDFYGVGEIAARLRREARHWIVDGEIAPGIEQIGSAGDAAGSLRAKAGVTYLLRPGRQFRVNLVYANSGIQQLSPTGGGDYRYASAGISILWRF
jgi:Flp pilus assembly protein TadD